jgi:hypothetical protein
MECYLPCSTFCRISHLPTSYLSSRREPPTPCDQASGTHAGHVHPPGSTNPCWKTHQEAPRLSACLACTKASPQSADRGARNVPLLLCSRCLPIPPTNCPRSGIRVSPQRTSGCTYSYSTDRHLKLPRTVKVGCRSTTPKPAARPASAQFYS